MLTYVSLERYKGTKWWHYGYRESCNIDFLGMGLLFLAFMIYSMFRPMKIELEEFTPTPIVLAMNSFNSVLGYNLLNIKRSTELAVPICLIILALCAVVGFYTRSIHYVFPLFALLFALILINQFRFMYTLQFFEHGMIYKGVVGDEKTVLYGNIHSANARFILSSVSLYFIEISYNDKTITALVPYEKLKEIINILINKGVNVE